MSLRRHQDDYKLLCFFLDLLCFQTKCQLHSVLHANARFVCAFPPPGNLDAHKERLLHVELCALFGYPACPALRPAFCLSWAPVGPHLGVLFHHTVPETSGVHVVFCRSPRPACCPAEAKQTPLWSSRPPSVQTQSSSDLFMTHQRLIFCFMDPFLKTSNK